MRAVVLISIFSCRLEIYTCCAYLCVECYESAEPVKKKGQKSQVLPGNEGTQVKVELLFGKYTFNKMWCSKCSSLLSENNEISSFHAVLGENFLSFFFQVEQ